MLREVSRLQGWRPSGYVCHACRHKALAVQVQRARLHGGLTASTQSDDDWFSNFNDLGTENAPSTPKSAPSVVRPNEGTNDVKGSKTRRERRDQSNEPANLKSSLSSRLYNEKNVKNRKRGLGVAATDLVQDVGTAVAGAQAKQAPKPKRRNSYRPLQRDPRESRAQSESQPVYAGDQTNNVKESVSVADSGASAMNKKVDDIVRQLQEEFRIKLPEMIEEVMSTSNDIELQNQSVPTEHQPFGDKSLEIDVEKASSHSAAIFGTDEVDEVPDGRQRDLTEMIDSLQRSKPLEVLTETNTPEFSANPPEPIDMPTFISTSSDLPPASRSSPIRKAKTPSSLVQKLEESSNRPKWGGAASASSSNIVSSLRSDRDANAHSSNSLPKKDYARMEPAPLKSSKAGASWDDTGGPQAASPFADSPADLAEIQISRSATKEKKSSTLKTSKSVFFDRSPRHTIDSLRQGLSLEPKNAKAESVKSSEGSLADKKFLDGAVNNGPVADVKSELRATDSGSSPPKHASTGIAPLNFIKSFFSGKAATSGWSVFDAPSNNSKASEDNEASASNESSQLAPIEYEAVEERHSDPASETLGKLHRQETAEQTETVLSKKSDTGAKLKKPGEKSKGKDKTPGESGTDRKKLRRQRSQQSAQNAKKATIVRKLHAADEGDGFVHKIPGKYAAGKKTAPNKSTKKVKADVIEVSTSRAKVAPLVTSNSQTSDIVSVDPSNLMITPMEIPQPPVPGLEYGLERVLFNPGVYQLQDSHSRVYNFDPYLQKIMPVVEFDYNALKEYKTSSQDSALSALAREHGKRYIGSTSSMTSTLGHFHYLLSSFRPINLEMLSRGFPDKADTFTQINRTPNAIFLRYKGNDTYAIDADKEFDGANVLMMLGKSMEKLLTLSTSDYERYRKGNSHTVSEEERTAPESFEYTTMGGFLMRSQLDAHDSRLPGTGMFDLKTRAVVSVRMNADNFQPMTGYEIRTLQGRFESYEREYYDMMRSTMLKYMLQVRMGRMDGIFVAYHNVERIFGFQYISLKDMDRALHGQTDLCLGDQEFKVSLEMMNNVLDKATAKFPGQSLRFHFETAQEAVGANTAPATVMWLYAEPMAEDDIDRIQSTSKAKVAEFERSMMGIERDVDSSANETLESNAARDEAVEAVEITEDSDDRPESDLAVLSRSDASADGGSESSTAAAPEDFSTTKTNADPKPISSAPADNLMPLFVASIICTSRVNGSAVVRPENLKPNDKWKLEYLLQEWETNEAMWARYADTKARRKKTMEQYRAEEDGESGEVDEKGGKKKKESKYIEFLRSRSKQGRELRGKIDQLEAGKNPVVIGQPLHEAKERLE